MPLNAQKRKSVSILGGYWRHSWFGASVWVKFEIVEFGQNFYIENILYFGHNLLLYASKFLKSENRDVLGGYDVIEDF